LKRLLAISLIAILLLNTMGYYVILLSMQYRHDAAVIKALDADHYEASNAVTLKFPISVPYLSDNNDFERVDGLIVHDGEHYRLVKQKYAKDTLTIVCIRDTERKKINDDMSEYVKSFTDKASGQTNSTKQSIDFIKDYLPQYIAVNSLTFGWESKIQYLSFSNVLISSFEPSVVHPPENLA